MLRIFTSVKIQRLWPGLNPRPWVPDVSMLTTEAVKRCLRYRRIRDRNIHSSPRCNGGSIPHHRSPACPHILFWDRPGSLPHHIPSVSFHPISLQFLLSTCFSPCLLSVIFMLCAEVGSFVCACRNSVSFFHFPLAGPP
jgi:hypothetical protein